jgi:hypothetical protein
VDRFSELLGRFVQFTCTAWGRIVLNGYIDRLQRPENIVHFFLFWLPAASSDVFTHSGGSGHPSIVVVQAT